MPSLSSLVPAREALEALLDDEGRHAARAHLGLGLGVDDQRVGVAAVGDPHLAAVEHVAVALLLGLAASCSPRRSRRWARSWPARRRARRSPAWAGISSSAPRCRCGGSGSRTGWSARRTTGPPRPRRARPLPWPRCAPGSPARCRRILPSPSCRAGRGRRASSTGRAGTGCRGRCRRRAARFRWRRSRGWRSRSESMVSPRSKFRPGGSVRAWALSPLRGRRAMPPRGWMARAKAAAYARRRRIWRHNGCKLRHDRSTRHDRPRPSSDPRRAATPMAFVRAIVQGYAALRHGSRRGAARGTDRAARSWPGRTRA